MQGAAVTPQGFSGITTDLTVPSDQVSIHAPSPYRPDGQIRAWALSAGQSLTADLGHARYMTDLTLRMYASQTATVHVQVDGRPVATFTLPAGQTRTVHRRDMPGMPWTLRMLGVKATCGDAQSACALVPGLNLTLLPPRDPGAHVAVLPGALLCAVFVVALWRLLSSVREPR